MKQNLKARLLVFFSILIIVLSISILILSLKFSGDSSSSLVKRKVEKEEIDKWNTDIQLLGGKKAFEKFKLGISKDNRAGTHFKYHSFGKVLYQQLGSEAIAICDKSLQFGCFHGVFSAAISQEGISTIYKLDETCIKKFTYKDLECKHGIGHGLMEYYGPKRVSFALDRCKELKERDRLGGCSSGVLMEYNFPSLIIGEDSVFSRRGYDTQNPDFPCDELKPEFGGVCYFELGKFWYMVYFQDIDKVGDICANVKKGELAKYCYMGIGNKIVAEFKDGLIQTLKQCSKLSDTDSQIYCRIGGSLSFAIEPDQIKERRVQKFCEGLGDSEKDKCVSLRNMDMTI